MSWVAAAPPAKRFKGAGKVVQQTPMSATSASSAPSNVTGNSGEVRFENNRAAKIALKQMQGSMLAGSPIYLEMDPNSKDQTRLLMRGISPEVEWQEVKDHFAQVGNLAFVQIHGHERKGPKVVGEVRYENAADAQNAQAQLNGSEVSGCTISVEMDRFSKDQTKLIITGLPAGTGWQDLKDHVKQVGGDLAYVNVIKGGAHLFGEVRYDDPAHAEAAKQMLQGTMLGGSKIRISTAPGSQDGSKLHVTGLGAGVKWQELKDHFAQTGTVAFAQVHTEPSAHQQLSQMGLPREFIQMAKGKGGNMEAMAPMFLMMGAMMGQDMGGGCGGKGYGKWGGGGGAWGGKGQGWW